MTTPALVIAPVEAGSSPVGVTKRSARGSHIPALDGLRGAAILLVLLSHLVNGELPAHSFAARVAFAIPRSGWAGVDLFFVLSGFLITGILLDQKAPDGSLAARTSVAEYFRTFYARRVLRIFPLYYGVLVAFFVVLPHVRAFPQEGLRQLESAQIWFWTYTSNICSAMTGAVFNAPYVMLNHFWSLAIEEQFYLVWPTVVLLCRPASLARVCVAVVALSVLARIAGALEGMNDWRIQAGTVFHLDAIAIGALLALLARRPGGLGRFVVAARAVFVVSLLALVAAYGAFNDLRGSALELAFTTLAIALFFGALLVLVLTSGDTGASSPASPLWKRLFELAPLRVFGRYSYGLYVLSSILQPFLNELFSTEILRRYTHSFALAGLVHLGLHISVCLAAAWVSFHLFERRFLSLKRYFEYATPQA